MSERVAMFWRKADNENSAAGADNNCNGAVRCELCPHYCVINGGGTGFCGARENHGGTLYAASYGRVTSLALDPIEKKPLYRFNPGSTILSVGGYGCNMSCGFCQNHTISQTRDNFGHRAESGHVSPKNRPESDYISPERLVEIAREIPKERRNIGVAFTYNEPTIGVEYILDAAPLLRAAGLNVVLVSNGQINAEPLSVLAPLIDAWNIDVKAFAPDFYKRHGGDLETTKRAVETAAKSAHMEVTTLVIPNENDDEGEIGELAKWLAGVSPDIPLHLSRFFPRYKYADREATPKETMYRLAEVAGQHLRHAFTGNMG